MQQLWRAIWPTSSKTEDMHSLRDSNSTPKYIDPRNIETCVHEDLGNNVYCSIISSGENWT